MDHTQRTTLIQARPTSQPAETISGIQVTTAERRTDAPQSTNTSTPQWIGGREVDRKPFQLMEKLGGNANAVKSMADALEQLPSDVEFTEGGKFATSKEENLWRLTSKMGILVWVLIIMKMEFIMPVFRENNARL